MSNAKIHRQRKYFKTEEEILLEMNAVKVSKINLWKKKNTLEKKRKGKKKDAFATYKSLMISCSSNKVLF